MTLLDVPTILTLAVLEILLSADNAVVLAALAQGLPEHQKKKALFYGILGAFVLRLGAIFCAVWIIKFWFLQVIGGGYLLWLAVSHLFLKKAEEAHPDKPVKMRGFWATVVAIELTDLAFAVDSVLAAVAMTNKMWVIYAGAVIGLIAMRFAAVMILKLLDKFPPLITYAYVMVLWIGIKLVLQGFHHCERLASIVPALGHGIFWAVMGVIIAVAVVHWFKTKDCKAG